MRELSAESLSLVVGGTDNEGDTVMGDVFGTIGAGVGGAVGGAIAGPIGAGSGAYLGGSIGDQVGDSLENHYVDSGADMVPEFDLSADSGSGSYTDYMEENGLHPESGF